MFNCYEFTFDGESSAMYGLMVYDIGDRGQSDVSFGTREQAAALFYRFAKLMGKA